MIQPQILTVSELTKKIKAQLEQPQFQLIALEGEISNFKHHTSGHMYFTLKDSHSRIRAVMFRGRNVGLGFVPQNGDTVVAIGGISVYEPNGEYQIYVEQLVPQGIGDLHAQFEELKRKLEAEGLFNIERKRPLPLLPRKVGVITSPTSAAVRDVLSVAKRRFPTMEILIIPAIVQGQDGVVSIVDAFNKVASTKDLDVVILTRGGGSLEELWNFNDEQVARAIYNCPIPVISGVGHETDFTIADFVADHRAPTPSSSAELAIPDYQQLSNVVEQHTARLQTALVRMMNDKRKILSYVTNRTALTNPQDKPNQERQQIDELLSKIQLMTKHQQAIKRQKFALLVGKLDSLSPLATLSRGYAVCENPNTNTVIKNHNEVKTGDQILVRLHEGRLWCEVEKGESIVND